MELEGLQSASLRAEIETLRLRVRGLEEARGAHELGHFYSPVPHPDDIASRGREMRRAASPRIAEIDLAPDRQLDTLRKIGEAIEHAPPFPVEAGGDFRYYYNNTQYGYNDAITLHGMLRAYRPKRVIEIGSGFSSAVMLDTRERDLAGDLSCQFIEPYPERLEGLLRGNDRESCGIFASRVQDVDVAVFRALGAGDFLFVDSSHVVKYGSDLEYIFRAVLPELAAGVFIHFHDIFYPFEYPESWIRMGHFWNECYMLRAFLANNAAYRIELFGDFIAHFHRDALEAVSPLCLQNTGGHIWLSKTAATRLESTASA